MCCSVLQCVAVWFEVDLMCCCSVLQCVAACCSVLQCVAVCCSAVWGRANALAQLPYSQILTAHSQISLIWLQGVLTTRQKYWGHLHIFGIHIWYIDHEYEYCMAKCLCWKRLQPYWQWLQGVVTTAIEILRASWLGHIWYIDRPYEYLIWGGYDE